MFFPFREKTYRLYYTSPNDYLVNNLLKITVGINRKGVFEKVEHTFAAAMAAILITGTIVAGFFVLEDHFSPEEKIITTENRTSVSESAEEKVVLGVFEGKLALFAGKSPYPNIVYDFLIRTLPKEDQKRLEEGITVSSQNELDSLLEDFMS